MPKLYQSSPTRYQTHYFGFLPMARLLTEGKRGNASIDIFTITGREFLGRDSIVPGSYARLMIGRGVMMSDTQMEQETNREALEMSRGDVLITGLGIGMLLVPVLMKDDVRSVTVIEKDADVIALALDQILEATAECGDKLTVIHDDANTWTPEKSGRQFDTIWLDIWGSCSSDELKPMRELRARYRRWLRKGGWLGSWWWDELRERKRSGY